MVYFYPLIFPRYFLFIVYTYVVLSKNWLASVMTRGIQYFVHQVTTLNNAMCSEVKLYCFNLNTVI